jgi:hypothetical protein
MPRRNFKFVRVAMVVAFAAVFAAAAHAADITEAVSEPLKCWRGGGCTNAQAEILEWQEFSAADFITSCGFDDHLPVGSRVRAMTIRLSTQRECAPFGSDPVRLDVYFNGHQMRVLNNQFIPTGFNCNCPNTADLILTDTDSPGDLTDDFYNHGGENAVTVIGTAGTGTLRVVDGSVGLSYSPPWTIGFNIAPTIPEADRRILLSNFDPRYPLPPFQTPGEISRQVNVRAHVTNAITGLPAVNLTMHFRGLDPPDAAPYMNLPVPNTLAHTDDNFCPLQPCLPKMWGSRVGVSDPGTAVINTDQNGNVEFQLSLNCLNFWQCSTVAAGDNYQIEMSADRNFARSAKSGVMTVWKRVFVEKHRMLRDSLPLARYSPQGTTEVHVTRNRWRNGSRISAGDAVALVHAPSYDRADVANGWYFEFHRVASVHKIARDEYVIELGLRHQGPVVPEPIINAGYGPDIVADGTGDAIALLTSPGAFSPADYFDAPDSLFEYRSAPADSAFPQAFVEYVVLPDGLLLPVPNLISQDDDLLQLFAERWSGSQASQPAPEPGQQLLFIADAPVVMSSSNPPNRAGETTNRLRRTASFVFRGAIDIQCPTTSLIPPQTLTLALLIQPRGRRKRLPMSWRTSGTSTKPRHGRIQLSRKCTARTVRLSSTTPL